MDRERGHLPHAVATAEEDVPRLNIITLGDAATGKSCLIKYFCEKKFVLQYISTLGIDYGVKRVSVPLNEAEGSVQALKVNFWDTAGDAAWKEVRSEFFADAHIVLLVYSVANRDSFVHLKHWLAEYGQYVKDPNQARLFLIANQVDIDVRLVTAEEGASTARNMGATYFETSAAKGTQVDELFHAIFTQALTLVGTKK